MAKYAVKVTMTLAYDLDTEEHLDEVEDDFNPDNEQDVREWLNAQLEDDVTEFGTPSIEKIELTKKPE